MEIEAEVELVKWVSKLIFELRKYNLNYLFKYSKSIRKSGRRWYDRAEFITAGLAGGRCSDLVKGYNVI